MACRNDDWGTPTRKEQESRFEHDSYLAEIFCATMQKLEEIGNVQGALQGDVIIDQMPAKARAWWTEHKTRDKARLERQVAAQRKEDERQAALNKLSPHERNLLGIK